MLRRVAQSIAERREEFSRTIVQEAGKPIKAARTEVDRAIFIFNVAAEELRVSTVSIFPSIGRSLRLVAGES